MAESARARWSETHVLIGYPKNPDFPRWFRKKKIPSWPQ